MWLYFRDLMDENIKELTEEIFFSFFPFVVVIIALCYLNSWIWRLRSTLFFVACAFFFVACLVLVQLELFFRRTSLFWFLYLVFIYFFCTNTQEGWCVLSFFLLLIHSVYCLFGAWSLFYYLRNACAIFFFVAKLFHYFLCLSYCFLRSSFFSDQTKQQ